MDFIKSVLVTMLVFVLTACASTKPSSSIQQDDATAKLAEAATSISQSLTDLKAIEKATSPPVNGKELSYPTSSDMDQIVSVDWSGPIEEILRRAALVSGFTPRVIGVPPASPVLVTISAHNVPLGYILRDANFQAGSKASLAVYPGIRVIELRYGKA